MERVLLFKMIFLAPLFGVWGQTNFLENYHHSILENGLEVLIIEDHSVPLVHIEMAFKTGGFVETPEIDGLSHLYEHMIFNATNGYPSAKSFNDKMLQLGILSNAGTDQEMANYFFTLPSVNFDEGLNLFTQGILHPSFLEEEFEKEKLIVNDEFQRYESDQLFLLDREIDHKLWGQFFSRKNVIGNHNVILTAKMEQLRSLHQRYHHPNNALLIVAGDINPDYAVSQIKHHYISWQSTDIDPNIKYAVPEFEALTKSDHFVLTNDNTEEPILLYAWQGPDTRNDVKSLFAAEVFFQMLGLQNSKIQQNIVETGRAFELSGRSTFSKYTSSMYLEVYPNPKKIVKTINSIEEEITLWNSLEYFSEDQLNSAKNQLVINEAYNQEVLSEYIHTVAYRWTSGDIDLAQNYMQYIQRVTLKDVNNFVKKYIESQPYSAGVIIPPQLVNEIKSIGWNIDNQTK